MQRLRQAVLPGKTLPQTLEGARGTERGGEGAQKRRVSDLREDRAGVSSLRDKTDSLQDLHQKVHWHQKPKQRGFAARSAGGSSKRSRNESSEAGGGSQGEGGGEVSARRLHEEAEEHQNGNGSSATFKQQQGKQQQQRENSSEKKDQL